MATPPRPIATLNEGPLHAALKSWYARPGDQSEVPIAGRQIDLVRGELFIEIQTSNLFALRKKLTQLLEKYPVRVVHPVVLRSWIVRVERKSHRQLGRRKSPREGRLEDAFAELVSLSQWLVHPRLSLELLLIEEEQLRTYMPGRAWRRRGWVTLERRLLRVVDGRLFRGPEDWRALLPPSLPAPFTTADLAEHLRLSRELAQKIAYCLRFAGAVRAVGKQGNAHTYVAAA